MKLGLVLAGGGAFGSFTTGFLKSFSDNKVKIEAISGTSIGAICGLFYTAGEIKLLFDIFDELKLFNPFVKPYGFPFPPIGMIQNASLLDNSGIENFLKKHINVKKVKTSDIEFISCAININNNTKGYFNNKLNSDVIIDSVVASSSIPFIFPPKKIKGNYYMDGSILENIPAKHLVSNYECDKYIIVLPFGEKIPVNKETIDKEYNIFNILPYTARIIFSMMNEMAEADILSAKIKYWKDNFIIVSPEKNYLHHILDIDNKRIKETLNHGYEMGKKIIKEHNL